MVLDLQPCACLYFRVLDTERENILVFPYKIYVSLDIRQASPFPIRSTIVSWVWCFSFVQWRVLEKVVVVIAVWHYECFEYSQWYVCSVTKSCVTLSDLMACSLLGSSVHGIFQARELGWVASSFSRGSSRPRECTSCIGSQIFYHWATWCVPLPQLKKKKGKQNKSRCTELLSVYCGVLRGNR